MGSAENYDPSMEYSCELCDKPDNYDNLVECSKCESWFHYTCAGFERSADLRDEDYHCGDCTKSNDGECSTANLHQDKGSKPPTGQELITSENTDAINVTKADDTSTTATKPKTSTATSIRRRSGIRNTWKPPESTNSFPFNRDEEDELELQRQRELHELELKFLNAKLQRKQKITQQNVYPSTTGPAARTVTFNTSKSNVQFPEHRRRETISSFYSEMASNWVRPNVLSNEQIAARHVLDKVKLPVFDGKPEDWLRFICNFENTTATCGYSNVENLGRLSESLKGKALDYVRGCLTSPDMVPAAIETLRMVYGRPELVISKMRANVSKTPPLKNMAQCIDFSLKVQHLCIAIESTKVHEYLFDYALIQELVNKLPDDLKLRWAMHTEEASSANLSVFSIWLMKIAQLSSKVTLYNENPSKTFEKTKTGSALVHTASEPIPAQASGTNHPNPSTCEKFKCPICKSNDHGVNKCDGFIKMSKNQRWDAVRDHRLCRTCLCVHNPRYCKQVKICGIDQCNRKHHPLLHSSNSNKSNNTPPSNSESTVAAHSASQNTTILYKMLPVLLHGSNGKCVKTLAFIDEGASISIMEQELAKKLDIKGPTEQLRLNWTSGMHRTEPYSQRIKLEVSGDQSSDEKYHIQVHTVSNLQLPIQQLGTVNQYEHLRDLPVQFYENSRPQLIIGLDNYHIVLPEETRQGADDEPMAIRTKLGWAVFGRIAADTRNECVLMISSQPPPIDSIAHQNTSENLDQLMKEYFSLESLGVRPSKVLLSNDNHRALDIMQRTTKRIDDKFETGLIWKSDDIIFPQNYKMALQRLISFEKKMARDHNLRRNVHNLICEYEAKGYIRKLHDDEPIFGKRVWYLPIFTVHNINKPDKCRIVWDAAAEKDGISLNSELLKGPDLINPLPAVLSRFREGKFAISGDIEEMYHRVLVRSEDQQSQRFLFRKDPTKPPEIFTMQVLTFGSASSPSSAIFTMNKNANENIESSPRAVYAITKNHYIDDWLDSMNDEKELLNLILTVRKIHQSGGFHIRKWITNSITIKHALDLTTTHATKNIGQTADKVLGIWWNTENDTINFSINTQRFDQDLLTGNLVPTKRQFLRVLMSIFDPLGLLAFIIIYGKIIMQEIWRTSSDWDELIKDEQFLKWQRWIKVLHDMDNIRIPRSYSTFGDVKDVELHVFMDASENAFACVAYWRFIKDGDFEVSLIGAKSRVAPNKPISIPRLELQAAVLASRFAKYVQDSHTYTNFRRYLWSDSSNVLSWIRSDARQYKQFVAVRIGEIMESTNMSEWYWVPSKQNVADDATKWQSIPSVNSQHRWFTGPSFLSESEEHWPVQNHDYEKVSLELKARLTHIACEKPRLLNINLSRFSDYKKLVNTQAFVLRASRKFKDTRNQQLETSSSRSRHEPMTKVKLQLLIKKVAPISPTEFKEAEILLFKTCQTNHFPVEFNLLLNNNLTELKSSSSLYRCSPYLDEQQVMRVSGRIDAINLTDADTKRPVILPNPHELTTLLAKMYHERFNHKNFETSINEIRRRFEIPKVRQLMKKIRRDCMMCKILYAQPYKPIMSPLPSSRLAAYERPFSHIGVDYFGPLYVVRGRSTVKRWGVLVTCLTIRAIHLEVAEFLNTSSCIMALRRVFALRGTPKTITSDQGTNFRGATNELTVAINNVDKVELRRYFHHIDWQFIPPHSPHMGGSWERLVRTVKNNITYILANRKLTDEVLYTTFCEVTQIINTRPLTDVLVDTNSQPALTPNDFLSMTSIVEKAPGVIAENERDLNIRLSKSWKMTQHLSNIFWKRWIVEYLPTLTKRTKWYNNSKEIQIGDIVIICDETLPRCTWEKGLVTDINRSRDNIVRSAVVKVDNKSYTRPVVKLAVLEISKPTCENTISLRRETVDDGVARDIQ